LNELPINIVVYCCGLPLTLKVFGSSLRDRAMEERESVLSKLKIIPIDQVQEKLKINFDGLVTWKRIYFLINVVS